MPSGQGWFIDLITGRVIPIYEHATAVASDPAAYRIEPDEIAGLSPFSQADRRRILLIAFDRGFARLRAVREHVVAEFDSRHSRGAIRKVIRFLEHQDFGALTDVEIHTLGGAQLRRPLGLLARTLRPTKAAKR